MAGTYVFVLCPKVPTPARNTTQVEMDAGNQDEKAIQHWFLHLFMGDLGISFDGPIPVAEDNAATCNTDKLGHASI
jgi:hypothetical protein